MACVKLLGLLRWLLPGGLIPDIGVAVELVCALLTELARRSKKLLMLAFEVGDFDSNGSCEKFLCFAKLFSFDD